ncbi:MAG: arylsulfatase [Pirellulales bacterium]|nr:arylsulfatase [Pirellulales bacterium]
MKLNRILLALAAVAACCGFAPMTAPATAAERKPNVVFILADDLGYRELGCFGQQLIRTPNLDRLAKQGMRFTQHYAGNAVCAPSRCVLLTGRHPGHAWIRNNRELKPEGQQPIPDGQITLAELLRDDGYATGAFGKWGLGGPGTEGDPLNQGFDRFFGYNCQRHAHSYYPAYLWNDDKRLPLDNDPPISGHARLAKGADPNDPRSYDRFKGTDYAPDRINEQVLAFIRANRDRPFFVYYPTVLPHLALQVPDEELKPYLELGWNDPPSVLAKGSGYTPHFTPRAAYAAMITRMDRYVGNVLDLLDKLGLADNTIVVFTSDNGTTHIKCDADYEFFNSVGSLRGLKGSLYEGGVRVPAIVRWPGHIATDTTTRRVTGFEDWIPTIVQLVGDSLATANDVDGVSFAPTLLGQHQPPRPLLYREFPGYGGQQSIRVGDWKAIRRNMRRGNRTLELYNLADDPAERKNVADKHPEIVNRLEATMSREHVRSELFPLDPIDAPARK